MVSKKKPTNPFYVLLLLAGSAFAITACAYGVMTVRQLSAGRSARWREPVEAPPSQGFDTLVDRYGHTALAIELVLLGIGTVGAIAFDQYLDKKQQPVSEKVNKDESASPHGS